MTTKRNPDGTPKSFTDPPTRDPSLAKLEAVDAMIQTLDQRLTTRLESLTAAIEALTNLDKLGEKIDRMADVINGHLRVAEAQTANIAALTNLATAIVSRTAA